MTNQDDELQRQVSEAMGISGVNKYNPGSPEATIAAGLYSAFMAGCKYGRKEEREMILKLLRSKKAIKHGHTVWQSKERFLEGKEWADWLEEQLEGNVEKK